MIDTGRLRPMRIQTPVNLDVASDVAGPAGQGRSASLLRVQDTMTEATVVPGAEPLTASGRVCGSRARSLREV